MAKAKPPKPDLIDRLRQQWAEESSALDTESMEVVGRVMLLASSWDGQVQQTLKPFKLTYTDFDILATLRRVGSPYELTPTQLLESVLLTSGAMTTALTRLQRAGLIARVDDANDRRSKKAKLTRKGVALAVDAAEKRFQTAALQIKDLSAGDQRILVKLLRKLL